MWRPNVELSGAAYARPLERSVLPELLTIGGMVNGI